MLRTIFECNTVKEEVKTLAENAIEAFTKDPIAIRDLIQQITSMPSRIRDGIYWENFNTYITHIYDYDEDRDILVDNNRRKLAEMLAEDVPNTESGHKGNQDRLRENVKRLVKMLDDAATTQKVVYYANATRAALNNLITRDKFFKLCKCINLLTEEDIDFLIYSIQRVGTSTISADLDIIDDFRAVGLLMEVENGFAYTRRAFELMKYSLKYEDDFQIPDNIQERMMVGTIDFKEIDNLL